VRGTCLQMGLILTRGENPGFLLSETSYLLFFGHSGASELS
jgi:hypothetical protein